jgi:hypothetical protein
MKLTFLRTKANTESRSLRHARRIAVWHATIRAQLGWYTKAGVRRAVFTHCGARSFEMSDGPRPSWPIWPLIAGYQLASPTTVRNSS